MTVETFALQSARVRRVIDYIGTHLDEDIALSELADLACLSASQLERLYFSKVRETPMATHRRLRLKRAHEDIRQGKTSLIDAGFAANYSSQAAFTRAFARQFGYTPSRLPLLTSVAEPAPQLRLENMPAREVFQLSYSGKSYEHRRMAGVLVGTLAVGGAKKWRNWQMLDRDKPLLASAHDRVELAHFVPASGQPDGMRGLDRVVQAGGLYAVHEALSSQQPSHLCALVEKIRAELGYQVTDGRVMLREINVGGYTAPQERRTALYIPVAPLR